MRCLRSPVAKQLNELTTTIVGGLIVYETDEAGRAKGMHSRDKTTEPKVAV
jgi:hypothetical protein